MLLKHDLIGIEELVLCYLANFLKKLVVAVTVLEESDFFQ